MSNIDPPIPIMPNFSADASSSDMLSTGNTSSSSQPPYDQLRTQNLIIQYISDLDRAFRPRMEKYEKTQAELKRIIEREKIIESSTRRLLHINFILCLFLPFAITLIFFVFCYYHVPNETKDFFNKYNVIISIFGVAEALAVIKPLIDIHGYNKRLDAIEKSLHLNGN